jgi:hypothetical protein
VADTQHDVHAHILQGHSGDENELGPALKPTLGTAHCDSNIFRRPSQKLTNGTLATQTDGDNKQQQQKTAGGRQNQ